jgi:hypothetical protein
MEYKIYVVNDGSLGRGNKFSIIMRDDARGEWRVVAEFELPHEIACGADMRTIAPTSPYCNG